MIGSYRARGYGQLGVERKEDGVFVGRCGLLVWDPADLDDHELDEPTDRSRSRSATSSAVSTGVHGYATEAAIAVRDWALAELGLERLIALIYPGNVRSVRVAEKLGMEPDGEIEIFGNRVTLYSLGKRPAL